MHYLALAVERDRDRLLGVAAAVGYKWSQEAAVPPKVWHVGKSFWSAKLDCPPEELTIRMAEWLADYEINLPITVLSKGRWFDFVKPDKYLIVSPTWYEVASKGNTLIEHVEYILSTAWRVRCTRQLVLV